MNLLVNAINARQGGGLRHLGPFLAGIGTELPEWTITACVGLVAEHTSVPSNVRLRVVEVGEGIRPERIVWDQVRVNALARCNDVILSPLNFGPVRPRRPQVMFQRNALYFDERYLETVDRGRRLRLLAHRHYAMAAARRSAAVIVPTAAMAELVGAHLHGVPLHVIPHGFESSAFIATTSASLPPAADDWLSGSPRLLVVSHPASHKNVEVIPEILRQLRGAHPAAKLAITMDRGSGPLVAALEAAAERAGVASHLVFLGRVEQTALGPLYGNADVCLIPSLCESFGFPVLEAFAAGVPVVASELPALREVSGSLAFFFAPRQAGEAVVRIEEALRSRSDEDRADRIRHAQRFSWREHCRAVAEVIRAAA